MPGSSNRPRYGISSRDQSVKLGHAQHITVKVVEPGDTHGAIWRRPDAARVLTEAIIDFERDALIVERIDCRGDVGDAKTQHGVLVRHEVGYRRQPHRRAPDIEHSREVVLADKRKAQHVAIKGSRTLAVACADD